MQLSSLEIALREASGFVWVVRPLVLLLLRSPSMLDRLSFQYRREIIDRHDRYIPLPNP